MNPLDALTDHQRIVLLEMRADELERITHSALEGGGDAKPRVLFASPVTGRVGDVFGGDWFIATQFCEYYTATGTPAYHPSVDLNRPGYKDSGAPVYAAADGVIVFAGRASGWQLQIVVIRHMLENGKLIWTRYAHLRDVAPLGQVKRGDLIGLIGDYTPVNDPRGDHLDYGISYKDLGLVPADWPGANRQRVLDDYIDPGAWHTERSK